MAVIRVGTVLTVLYLYTLGGAAAFFSWANSRVTTENPAAMVAVSEPTMAAIDHDDRPKKKISHEIGQDLSLLSVKELDERIALLQGEIARLEANKIGKQASRQTADQFFKK
jgi:uncharacterized small protein (DUF1192 family)